MHWFSSKRCVLLVLLHVLVFPQLSFSGPRTLKRTEDSVVVWGDDLGSLSGAEIGELRLMACKNRTCRFIPSQIDKRDSEERYIFPDDSRRDPLRDGTRLDSNDELVFMASDAGDRLGADGPPFPASRAVEIGLLDPMDGGRAWVYLLEGAGVLPDAKVTDYVSYTLAGDNHCIRSDRYFISWREGAPYYDTIKIRQAGSGLGADILDRQRSGIVADLPQQDITLNVPESMGKIRDLGFIDGPVRVVVDEVMYVNFAVLKFQYGSEYFFSLYRYGHTNLIDARFPTQLNRIFKRLEYYWALDFSPDMVGSTYRDPGHMKGVIITGEDSEVAGLDAEHYWWSLHGPWGSLMEMMIMSPELQPYFHCEGMLIQDEDAKDKHGEFPGRLQIGLTCKDTGGVPKTMELVWRNYLLFPGENSAKGVEALVNMVKYPLQVETRAIHLEDESEPPS